MATDSRAGNTPALATPIERILAYIVASADGVSILSFLVVIIATAVGVRDFGAGAWPTAILLPYFGLPLAILALVALVIALGVRRSREAKDARK